MEVSDVKAIVEWVTENAEGESRFLSPYPRYKVDAQDLLDLIAYLSGADKESIAAWSNTKADEVDAK